MDGEVITASHWFRELVRKHRETLVAAAAEGRFVLVPQTASLSSWSVRSADVAHHVLEAATPGAPRGEYRTLSGRGATVTASHVVAGAGFAERVEATILSATTIAVELPAAEAAGPKRQGRLHVYFISRPLQGGIAAPSSVDELTPDGIRKYLAMLRSAPDADGAFATLEAGVQELERDLRRAGAAAATASASASAAVGSPGSGSGASAAAPSAAAIAAAAAALAERRLRELGSAAVEQVLDSATFEDDSEEAFVRSRQLVTQCLESWAAERLHDVALPVLRAELAAEVAQLRVNLGRAAAHSQADLGIKPAFQCDFGVVSRLLAGLTQRRTPLEKLHCVRDASLALRGLVERHLEAAKVDLAEVDLGADDELPILAWAALQAQLAGEGGAGAGAGAGVLDAGAELPLHFAFAQRFRLPGSGELELSQLGYRLANMEQSVGLFLNSEGGARRER